MIHTIVTCDVCNPQGQLSGRPSGRADWRWQICREEFGWRRIKGKHVCPECQEEAAGEEPSRLPFFERAWAETEAEFPGAAEAAGEKQDVRQSTEPH